jgi:hypothetical protein
VVVVVIVFERYRALGDDLLGYIEIWLNLLRTPVRKFLMQEISFLTEGDELSRTAN